DLNDLVLGVVGAENKLATVLEHEGHRPVLAQIAAMFGERVAYIGHGTGPVIRHTVDDDCRTADAIAFIAYGFIVFAIGSASAARNGALDVVFRHIGSSGFVPGQAQGRIGIRIGAAGTCSGRNLTDDFCPDFSTLGILATFAVLDICPFTVTCHGLINS